MLAASLSGASRLHHTDTCELSATLYQANSTSVTASRAATTGRPMNFMTWSGTNLIEGLHAAVAVLGEAPGTIC